MVELNLSSVSPNAAQLLARLQHKSGVRLTDCYQCGKCTASCPLAPYMEVTPRQIVRYLQLAQLDVVLNSQTPWICATCHTCSCRCPHEINLTALMEALRQEAKLQGKIAINEVNLFTNLFMKTVYAFGRSHEMLMTGCYNLFSLHFFQDLLYAPKLYLKRKIHILPHRVKDRAAVRRLIAPYDIRLRFKPFAQARVIILSWFNKRKKRGEEA